MANAIELFKIYIDMLDEVYQTTSTTADFDTSGELVTKGANAGEYVIPKISMDGLADYSRNSGYVSGDVDLTMETMKSNYDRGRTFNVDAMDNQETAGVAFGKLSSEFVRTKTTPELDAFRYALYAGTTGVTTVSGTLADGNAALLALQAAQSAMDDDEVPETERYLRITPALYNAVMNVDTTKSKEVLASFTNVKKVPQARFYDAIDLLDGTTSGEEAGGYKKATDAKDINFMVVHKPAVVQYGKHNVNKVVTPEMNNDADAYKFNYRANGIAEVYENKLAGIYVHKKA